MVSSNLKNIVLTVFASAVVVFVLFWAFTPAPVPVDLVAAGRAPMEVTIGGEGRTQVHDIYTVSAPLSGRIHRIEVHVGDEVIAGQTLLASVEPSRPQVEASGAEPA